MPQNKFEGKTFKSKTEMVQYQREEQKKEAALNNKRWEEHNPDMIIPAPTKIVTEEDLGKSVAKGHAYHKDQLNQKMRVKYGLDAKESDPKDIVGMSC